MACKMFIEFYNGYKMPALGFGTWQCTDEECEQAMEEALKAGYRHIDTAFAYGNEHVIGKVINRWISSGKIKREDLFITTKLAVHYVHPDRVEEGMKKSLENLQLDYVDLYLVHCPMSAKYEEYVKEGKYIPEHSTDLEGVWKKMEDQVRANRTKNIGISNFNEKQIQRILKVASIKPANHQIEVHLYMQQEEMIDFCKKNGITVVAYSPLASPGYNSFLKSLGKNERQLPNILSNPTLVEIAGKYNKSTAQVALRYLLQIGVAPIPKSSNAKRLRENIDVFDFQLDKNDMAKIKKLNVGPSARVCDFKVFEGITEYPEYPF